jgi:hypothetical protein
MLIYDPSPYPPIVTGEYTRKACAYIYQCQCCRRLNKVYWAVRWTNLDGECLYQYYCPECARRLFGEHLTFSHCFPQTKEFPRWQPPTFPASGSTAVSAPAEASQSANGKS